MLDNTLVAQYMEFVNNYRVCIPVI